MKKQLLIVSALAALAAAADTDYPITAEVAAANRAKVTAAGAKGSLAVATVEAMSPIKRTPDLYPEDADFTGALRFIAAQGEYEPGSLSLYAFEDVERCSADVEGIPADWLDMKVVKVWYQMGTASRRLNSCSTMKTWCASTTTSASSSCAWRPRAK